jgi:hypothetical protein
MISLDYRTVRILTIQRNARRTQRTASRSLDATQGSERGGQLEFLQRSSCRRSTTSMGMGMGTREESEDEDEDEDRDEAR